MISVGGNTTALIQVKDEGKKNIIGEKEHVWMDVTSLKDWWTAEDAKRFEERAQVMVNFFDSIQVFPVFQMVSLIICLDRWLEEFSIRVVKPR